KKKRKWNKWIGERRKTLKFEKPNFPSKILGRAKAVIKGHVWIGKRQ
ncbi:unnamed protein product, partial [Brassica oleracea var. botrytis]